jgi:hypothetical protein
VRDKLTELEGTAIAKVVYLNGCVQYQVMPRELKDSKPVEDIWIDSVQLEVIEEADNNEVEPRHGGHRSHPF